MTTDHLFQNRYDAGLQLAELIAKAQPTAPIVYGIPRGGVIVAAPIASQLGCPLDVAIAKKIALPSYSETAIGAITSDGYVLNFGKEYCTTSEWEQAMRQADVKAQELLFAFAPFRPQIDISGKTAILVDDGIATGATIVAIAATMQHMSYKEIWIAVPVAPQKMSNAIAPYINRAIILTQPSSFISVSCFYSHFPEVTTSEALSCFQLVNS